MSSKSKEAKFFNFPHSHKKHRVRKGLSEALGVLGLKAEDEENLTNKPSITLNSIIKPHSSSETLSNHSSEPRMSIFSSLKKDHHKRGSSPAPRGSSPAPTASSSRTAAKPTSTPSKTLLLPRISKREVDGISVNSIAPTVVSDSTLAQEDHSVVPLKKAKSAISRASSPLPTHREPTQIKNVDGPLQELRARLQAELKASKEEYISNGISIESFLGFIGQERLRRMPAEGSRWDKILKWAEYFATSLSVFEEAVDTFVASSKETVELIFECFQILLQMGPTQGEALETVFAIFHEYGLIFDFYLRNYSLLRSIPEARQELSLALADILGLSVEITVYYRKSSKTMSTSSVTLEFNVTFGKLMDSFMQRKDRITSVMWTYQLKSTSEISDIHVSIDSIRQWLLPQDRTLQAIVTGRRASRTLRAEFTCEWFERSLVHFARSKDPVLTVTAETGAGKSMLSSWIVERLQRPVGRHTFQAVTATIDSQIPAQATQTALVKALILQLLDLNVGNVALYRCLANVRELDDNTDSIKDAEDALWYTLNTGLKSCKDVVLVIDGLDALEGNETEKVEVFEHLHDIATKNSQIRVVILSRPLSKPWSKPTRQVTMGPERTIIDVKHIAREYMISHGIGSKKEIDVLVEQIAQRSKGSLTWAQMALQLFQKAKNVTEAQEVLKTLPGTTKEIIDLQISNISLKDDARFIFAWLLVAERSLTTAEIQTLLELNVQKGSHQPRSSSVLEDLYKSCSSLVIVQDKTVRFRNETVRFHLLELSKGNKNLLPPAEAQKSLATRLLLYIKACIHVNTEPSLEDLSSKEVDSLFRTNALLEYASRNWLNHFQRSPYFADGKLQPINPELKSVFPNSTLLALLERSCWGKQMPAIKANGFHTLALNVRQQALGENAQCTLQGSINVAQSYIKLSAPAEASKFFYQAAKIGQAVLGKTNELAISCATASIDSSENVKITERNEDVTRKEEMLKYVVETEKQQKGSNSTLVAKYNNQLAQLYTEIKENDKAEQVYREVYKATTAESGEFSEEAKLAAEKLKTVLYQQGKHNEVVQYTQPIFEFAEQNLEIFDISRVEITLRMADTYEEKKDFTHAEELYISLWRDLTEYCRTVGASDVAQERKIQISVSYARFLRRQKREAEALNILHGVWVEYQHRDNSEAVTKQLSNVGDDLKAMGAFESAIEVLKSVWGYFKKSGQQTSAAAVSTAVSLMDAAQAKVDSKKADAKASGTEATDLEDDEGDDEADAIMDEVLEAAIVSTPKSADTKNVVEKQEVSIESTIKTYETLCNFYTSKERWTEAADLCQKLLVQIWPTLSVEGKYGFPKIYTTESIKFARRLALCYSKSNQTEQAEKIYVHVFQSARSGLRIQDELVVETSNDLIKFHISTQQYQKALVVYQQLLESYRTTLGARNPLTIQTLYIMGDLCVKYRVKGADHYYLEVTKAEKSSDGILSKESMRAALALSKIYFEQKRWQEARSIYATIWVTFTTRAREYKLTSDLVQAIYTRYTAVLETHLKVDIEVIHKLAVEYRNATVSIYGAESHIATTANLSLAEISIKSSKYHAEAVKICEEVVQKAAEAPADKPQTPAQLSILAKAKRQLAALYASQASTENAPEQAQKAETLWKEQLEINKKEHGVMHTSTLASLSSLVIAWAKSDKPEVQKQAQQQLSTSVVEILSAPIATDSTKLHESAVSLANIYLSCNYSAQAWALLKDLRLQIINKGARSTKAVGIKLPVTVDRRSIVFLAAFEETLRKADTTDAAKKATFSDIMTDMLTEGILYDRYTISIQSKELSIDQKLFDGARLYAFLATSQLHAEQSLATEDALYKIFTESYGTALKDLSGPATRTFFVALLVELGRLRHSDDLAIVGCSSGIAKVYALLLADQYAQALEVATVVYNFTLFKDGFKHPRIIPFAFKLSLYLSGLGVKKSSDLKLQARMVELSKTILRETLRACKTLDIDIVQLQASELNNLVRLMGEQKNYEDLEWLLTQLWNSRIIQASWSATTVISVGCRLVEVLFVRNKQDQSIALAESMCYNLSRTWGLLDPVSIDVHNLLSSLYIAANRYNDALILHAEILRAELADDLDVDDQPLTDEAAAQVALQQLDLIKRIYSRQGGWGEDPADDLSSLVSRVAEEFADLDVAAFGSIADSSKWSPKAPPAHDTTGLFVAPASWEFAHMGTETEVAKDKKPDYLLRWLQLNRQQSFGDLSKVSEDVNGTH
ncbi:nacht domain protein [Penicillium taxi]|uniref:nacht domain protein n=1 Tax=Penicillium taxi TaxID=168475 RepID=UPI002545B6FF|nr:nacht domain protein [Penicillium taxi]KAJ5888603.1 nacht domain protein [Penicillium taxi]